MSATTYQIENKHKVEKRYDTDKCYDGPVSIGQPGWYSLYHKVDVDGYHHHAKATCGYHWNSTKD